MQDVQTKFLSQNQNGWIWGIDDIDCEMFPSSLYGKLFSISREVRQQGQLEGSSHRSVSCLLTLSWLKDNPSTHHALVSFGAALGGAGSGRIQIY